MDERDRAFFEDLAAKIDRMTVDAVEAVRQPDETTWEEREALRVLHAAPATQAEQRAFQSFVNELLRVLTHSTLVTIDGGTEYADSHGTPRLTHGDGTPFGEALHELFMEPSCSRALGATPVCFRRCAAPSFSRCSSASASRRRSCSSTVRSAPLRRTFAISPGRCFRGGDACVVSEIPSPPSRRAN